MFLSAFERPEFMHRTAIIYQGHHYTYGLIASEARQIAVGLQLTFGVRPGDRVALHFTNSPDFVTACLACERSGATAVPIRWLESPLMVADWCNYLDVKAILADEQSITPLLSNLTELKCRNITTPLRIKAGANPIACHKPNPLFILHTSGSTARPKAVMQSFKAVDSRALIVADYIGFQPDDVVCVVSDLSQGWGLHNLMAGAFAIGAAILIFNQRQYDDADILEQSAEHGVTVIGSNPSRFRKLLQAILKAPRLPTLRFALASSDRLQPAVAQQWQEVFDSPLLETWGMREANCSIWNRLGDNETGTVGRLLPGVRARIVDAEGHDLPDGSVGELLLTSDYLFSGYWGDRERTQKAMNGEWLKTEDQFIRQRSGRYCFISRAKWMIKRSGTPVSPLEVEDALKTHPAIAECVAIGVPSEEWGQEVEVFVEFRYPVAIAELRSHANRTCSVYMRPSRYWLLSSTPETSAGKVARDIELLRASAKELLY
jgi:acyl-coenzyme A synthetase/AMP-(fatty) acid ligase